MWSTSSPRSHRSAKTAPERVHYIDNLRTFLTVLLVFHHSGIECPVPTMSPQILVFNSVNPTYMWGVFFFISGYCAAISSQNKTMSQFVARRLLRFGIPALVYGVLLHPVVWLYVAYLWEDIFSNQYRSFCGWARVEGPEVYLFFLLSCDLLYVLYKCSPWSKCLAKLQSGKHAYVAVLWVGATSLLFLYTVVAASFIHHPTSVMHRLGYYTLDPQFPFAPLQYIIFYAAGIYFSRREQRFILPLPYATGLLLLATTGASMSFLHLAEVSQDFRDMATRGWFLHGGPNHPTALYAAWSTLCGFSISHCLVSTFAGCPLAAKEWYGIARFSYPMLFIHKIPAQVVRYYSGVYISPKPIPKALLGGCGGVVISWVLCWTCVRVAHFVKRWHSYSHCNCC